MCWLVTIGLEHGAMYLHAAHEPSDAPLGPPHRTSIAQLRALGGAFPPDAAVRITR